MEGRLSARPNGLPSASAAGPGSASVSLSLSHSESQSQSQSASLAGSPSLYTSPSPFPSPSGSASISLSGTATATATGYPSGLALPLPLSLATADDEPAHQSLPQPGRCSSPAPSNLPAHQHPHPHHLPPHRPIVKLQSSSSSLSSSFSSDSSPSPPLSFHSLHSPPPRSSSRSHLNLPLPPPTSSRPIPHHLPTRLATRSQPLLVVPTHMAAPPASAPPASDLASAQHIRHVYAHLDKVGVPGDGFAEGLERTREHRRLSALAARGSTPGGELTAPELAVLRRADRYGFFKPPPAERVVCLERAAFFPAAGPSPVPRSGSAPAMVDGVTSRKETSRIEKWTAMLEGDRRDAGANILSYRLSAEWDGQRARFEKRCFKGVPDRWRPAVWELLMAEFEQHGRAEGRTEVARLRAQFARTLDAPSEQDVQIDLDVPRTINGHIFFHTRYGRGQRALFQVLHTFGMYCKTCGYCQGMGPIAATLLSYFSAETAFVCMVRIHDAYGYHRVFAPGFPGLLECFYVQERLIEHLAPKVHKTFKEQMISTSAYATKWYITMFANTVSYEAQLRLWDVFFLMGMDAMVLGAVSIVYALRTCVGPGNDFEQILSRLGGRFEMGEGQGWVRSIRKLYRKEDVRKIMEEARLQWKGFVADGSALKRVT